MQKFIYITQCSDSEYNVCLIDTYLRSRAPEIIQKIANNILNGSELFELNFSCHDIWVLADFECK